MLSGLAKCVSGASYGDLGGRHTDCELGTVYWLPLGELGSIWRGALEDDLRPLRGLARVDCGSRVSEAGHEGEEDGWGESLHCRFGGWICD
jgi:hypothetical protein